jgi:DTW domain-containing protein YfiP
MARRYCERCEKPDVACLCGWISPQANRLAVLILQHPDETRQAIGTAKLVERGLQRAHVEAGLQFDQSETLALLSQWSASRPLLLYPERLSLAAAHFALDFETEHFTPPALLNTYDSLILLDGTWRNTRELLLANKWLSTLPTLEVRNAGSSRYRIRQAKKAGALATIEAVSNVLSVLDAAHKPELFLRPFEKMIDFQINKMGQDVYRKHYLQTDD